MNTPTITPLDEIGKDIVFGRKPYHTTDEYKQNLHKRIATVMEERGEDFSEESVTGLINMYTTPATKEEREEIVKSIEETCILPFDPADLNMFKPNMLIGGIQKLIEKKDFYPHFLTLGSAEIIGEKKEGGWQETLGPIELNLSQYNNQLSPILDEDEIKKLSSNPYRILMKISYIGQDEIETLPLIKSSQTRQGRRKYDISFVILEDTNKTPGYTLIPQGFHVNKKEMNKEEFIKWFEDNKKGIVIPKSIDGRSGK